MRERWGARPRSGGGRVEGANEEAASRASAERRGPAWLEWIADGADAGLLERADDGPGDAREQVGVLVGVDVREFEAGALQLLDLCECFALDVVLADGAAENAECEVGERVAEGAAVRTEQCGDALPDRRLALPSTSTM